MQKIYEFFGIENGESTMKSGEAIVIGEGEAEIPLGNRLPQEALVFFEDSPDRVPCDHHHHDKLHWEIKIKHDERGHGHHHDHDRDRDWNHDREYDRDLDDRGQDDDREHGHRHGHEEEYVLKIRWHVSGVRVIKWQVWF